MPTISQLPVASTVNPGDLFVIVQSGVTKQVLDSLVITAIQTGLTITESQVTGLTADLAARMLKSANLSDVASVSASRINLGLPALTNGQLWIGDTGLNPVAAALTAGANIGISLGAGSIIISATGAAGFTWTNVAGTTQAMAVDSGYVANNGSLVTFTLPVTSAVGDGLKVVGRGAGGWSIVFNASQYIVFGSSTATTTTGSISSTNKADSISLICTVADTEWTVDVAPQGILTVV